MAKRIKSKENKVEEQNLPAVISEESSQREAQSFYGDVYSLSLLLGENVADLKEDFCLFQRKKFML